jgi:tryptophanyl-tRNA synthetase
MSKSHPDAKSRILLTDPPDLIASKIRSAVTDSIMDVSEAWQDRPGVRNLFAILSGMVDRPVEGLVDAYRGKNAGQLKGDLTEALVDALTPIRTHFERLMADQGHLAEMEELGRRKASEVAARTLAEVKEAVGLR